MKTPTTEKSTSPRNQIPARALQQLKRYTTARQLARKAQVSKVHAYRLIELIGAEHALETTKIREKATGPLSVAYRFASASARRKFRAG